MFNLFKNWKDRQKAERSMYQQGYKKGHNAGYKDGWADAERMFVPKVSDSNLEEIILASSED
jgi:hypothetical protein